MIIQIVNVEPIDKGGSGDVKENWNVQYKNMQTNEVHQVRNKQG